ncbi:MAG: Lin0512 family protein [Litoreibacter sp.]|uniref:Lin0512 family protein n=1 Tax=Litoreibacter sp. TaxID=1969459 RepID=UPI003299325D
MEHRIILEMGTGNDLYGLDYTKAAKRAIQDALHHSSIVMFKSLNIPHEEMRVQVTIGVQHPERLDIEALTSELPRGRAQVTGVLGGLDVHDPDNDQTHVIATAAIEAFVPIDATKWKLSR